LKLEGRPETKEKSLDVSYVQSSKRNSSMLSGNCVVQPQKEAFDGNSDPPVQTYIDEKAHVRVNRVRGMGVRLTRDLQWNLYLMKESEEQSLKTVENNGRGSDSNRAIPKDETLTSQADASHCQMNEDEVGNLGMEDINYENESFCNASASASSDTW
jgi:DNA excision repair protein ERCC-5